MAKCLIESSLLLIPLLTIAETLKDYKMSRRLIHVILILLLLIGIKQCIHFGDYESGMAQGLLLLFVFSIFFVIFSILLIVDLYKLIRFKKRFDFIPLLLLFLFSITFWFGFAKNEKPFFWKKEFYKGEIYSLDCNDKLFLYKNGTFAFEIQFVEHKNIVCGKFKILNDTLKLSEYNTYNVNSFTNSYLFIKDSSLVALKNGYYPIKKIK